LGAEEFSKKKKKSWRATGLVVVVEVEVETVDITEE
jgi:hypothetical protein